MRLAEAESFFCSIKKPRLHIGIGYWFISVFLYFLIRKRGDEMLKKIFVCCAGSYSPGWHCRRWKIVSLFAKKLESEMLQVV